MKKKLIFIIFFSFCLGFLSNTILIKITKSREPFFLKWECNEEGTVKWFSFDDKNGFKIIGNYNSIGLEMLSTFDDKKEYNQVTVFGKTYGGPIESINTPENNEMIEIDSFLSRSELINNHELKYYIVNSKIPKIIINDDGE